MSVQNNISSKFILVVDNAKSLNAMICTELTSLGYVCDSAFSLKNIKEKTQTTTYNYVVLNLYLQDSQEEELIKNVSKMSSAKIIILTSAMNNLLRDRIFEHGILDYLYKQNITKTITDIDNLIKNVERNLGSNVLVIDETNTSRSKIKNILGLRNYNVMSTRTGEGGLKIIENEEIDLLILDMQLDDMHGLDVLNQIKSNPKNCFPVIALSSSNGEDIVRKALKGGVVDFINKPVAVEEFLLKSDLWVDNYRQSKELEDYKNHLRLLTT